jgi:hypothetical protein
MGARTGDYPRRRLDHYVHGFTASHGILVALTSYLRAQGIPWYGAPVETLAEGAELGFESVPVPLGFLCASVAARVALDFPARLLHADTFLTDFVIVVYLPA